MKRLINLKHIAILVPIIITILCYALIFKAFFQQDEWVGFGHYLSTKETFYSIFQPYVSHYVPLSKLFFSIYVHFFKLEYFWYALASITAHLITVCLVYYLSYLLSKNKLLSLLVCTLFAVGASSHQATSWIAADINTHGATIFALLALIVFYKYNKVYLSVGLLCLSLLFKEIAMAFFVIMPLMFYLFRKKDFLDKWRHYLKIPIAGLLYGFFRFSMVFFQRSHLEDRLVIETQSISAVVINMITFPVKIFSQSILPTRLLLSLAKNFSRLLPPKVSGLYGTTAFDVFTENTTLQVINWAIFALCLLIFIYVFRKVKNNDHKNIILFGYLFSLLNSVVYVLSPGRLGNIPVVDSRNIYLPSLGTAILLTFGTYQIFKVKLVKTTVFISLLVLINITWLVKELHLLASSGAERKAILYQISDKYPQLPTKTVFYTVSDKAYYGLPETEKIFPFEVNFGYILMVWYQTRSKFPSGLIDQTNFLYGLTKEGYKEVDGKGFGYFRNWQLLTQAIKENGLQEDSIIAFAYHSDTKALEDITDQVRKKINVKK